MVNVAMVGYSKFNSGIRGDLVDWMPGLLEGEKGLHYCYVGVLDAPEADIYSILEETINSGADVLHFANYRDPYSTKPVDEVFLGWVRRRCPNMPILLTSGEGTGRAEEVAAKDKVKAEFMPVPFDFDDYVRKLQDLAQKKKEAA